MTAGTIAFFELEYKPNKMRYSASEVSQRKCNCKGLKKILSTGWNSLQRSGVDDEENACTILYFTTAL